MKRINEIDLLKVLKLTYAVVEKDGYVSRKQEQNFINRYIDIQSPYFEKSEILEVRTSAIVKKLVTENPNDFKIKIPESAASMGYGGQPKNGGSFHFNMKIKDGVSYDDYADELNKANTTEMEKEFQNIIEWVKTETTSQIEKLQSEYQEQSREFYQQLNDIATTQIVSMSKESSALGLACYLYSWYSDRETYYAKQAENDAKTQARAAKRAKIENSTWVPHIETKGKSERAEFTVEVLDAKMIELPWSFATGEQLYIVTMCTEAGNILVVKTSTINDALNALLSGYVIKGEHISPTGTYGHPYDPYYTWLVTDVDNENNRSNPELPVIVKIKGTIKERTEYKGNKQTVLNRIALVEVIQ